MPKDYATQPPAAQRRPELAQDDDWIRAFLARTPYGTVATRWEQQPFLTPTTFWYDGAHHQLVFHSNVVGRVRANAERYPEASFAASHFGQLLPSNVALEFSIQYESVIAFGTLAVLETPEAKQAALQGLLQKYFSRLTPGQEYRPITDQELRHTSVYALRITSWSGKRNWPAEADQSDEWPRLTDASGLDWKPVNSETSQQVNG